MSESDEEERRLVKESLEKKLDFFDDLDKNLRKKVVPPLPSKNKKRKTLKSVTSTKLKNLKKKKLINKGERIKKKRENKLNKSRGKEITPITTKTTTGKKVVKKKTKKKKKKTSDDDDDDDNDDSNKKKKKRKKKKKISLEDLNIGAFIYIKGNNNLMTEAGFKKIWKSVVKNKNNNTAVNDNQKNHPPPPSPQKEYKFKGNTQKILRKKIEIEVYKKILKVEQDQDINNKTMIYGHNLLHACYNLPPDVYEKY